MSQIRKLKTVYVDSLEGKYYQGYVNLDFYKSGYLVYFTFETACNIVEDTLTHEKEKDYKISFVYDRDSDSFVLEDLENGYEKECFIGQIVETEHGNKHLYPIGPEWMWNIKSGVNKKPTICNICGGKVVYIDNEHIYNRSYGSGKCYFCTECGAYVGTHEPVPDEAYGILADAEMRQMKIKCHSIFDKFWNAEPSRRRQHIVRKKAYLLLAKMLEIPTEECHFGYMDKEMLEKAYEIIKKIGNSTKLKNKISYKKNKRERYEINEDVVSKLWGVYDNEKDEYIYHDKAKESCVLFVKNL